MKLDIIIDKLTPCLEEVSTGKLLQTIFSIATSSAYMSIEWKF